MNSPRFLLLAGMILAAAASRLLPHPPNCTPIAAMALFGGASFADKRAVFLVPLAGLPFFQNTLAGDLFYCAILFGGLALAERRFGALRERAPASSPA
ncbi:MAG: hypothetical protein KGS61_07320 [Verrucomicrobia bacterium]|nr:hypothetical protein [Verrucomicrobiota bacterium]